MHMTHATSQRRAKCAKRLTKENVSACPTKRFNRPGEDTGAGTLASAIAGATDAAIDVALRATAGNRAAAAATLGITVRTLYRLLAARKKTDRLAKEVS